MRFQTSLFALDFNRYIIGTNSRTNSRTYIKDVNGIQLQDITNAVAHRIKEVYKYSYPLSNYDSDLPYNFLLTNSYTRIGTKYLRFALSKVKA